MNITKEKLYEIFRDHLGYEKSIEEFIKALKEKNMLYYERTCHECNKKYETRYEYSFYCEECIEERMKKKEREYH